MTGGGGAGEAMGLQDAQYLETGFVRAELISAIALETVEGFGGPFVEESFDTCFH